MKNIILLDIDGTLIDNGLYPKNFNTIKKQISMLRKHYTIGICTYRSFDLNVKKVIKDYGLNKLAIVEGGACIFKRNLFKYRMVFHDGSIKSNLNNLIKNILLVYMKNENISASIKISNDFILNNTPMVVLNSSRKMSSTIRFSKAFEGRMSSIIDFLKKNKKLSNMSITKSYDNELKLNILPKNINKMYTMENYFQNLNVIFITDFEEVLPFSSTSLIKVFSVGTNENFNSRCDGVFSPFGKGVEEILANLI